MKLFFIFFTVGFGWFLDEGLPKKSKNFYEILQLRVDQMFRDTIAEHRNHVEDTDERNPGHKEAEFRKEMTKYATSLVGVDDSIRTEIKTDGRLKMTFSVFKAGKDTIHI